MAASDPIFLGIGGPGGTEQIDAYILFGLTDGGVGLSQQAGQRGGVLLRNPGRVGRVGGYINIMKGVRKLENVTLSWWKWTAKLHLWTLHSWRAWKQGFLPTMEAPKYKYWFIGPVEIRNYVKVSSG